MTISSRQRIQTISPQVFRRELEMLLEPLQLTQALENDFDHDARLLRFSRTMTGEQSEDHRTVDQVQHDLRIDIGTNIATVHAAAPHDPSCIAPRIQEPLSKQRQKPWVALTFGDELTKQTTCRRTVECHHRFQLLCEILLCRTCIRKNDTFSHPGQKGIKGHVTLIRPPFVDSRFADTSPPSNRIHGHPAKWASLQQVECRLQNCGLSFGASVTATRLCLRRYGN
jgi:hypothetical protein